MENSKCIIVCRGRGRGPAQRGAGGQGPRSLATIRLGPLDHNPPPLPILPFRGRGRGAGGGRASQRPARERGRQGAQAQEAAGPGHRGGGCSVGEVGLEGGWVCREVGGEEDVHNSCMYGWIILAVPGEAGSVVRVWGGWAGVGLGPLSHAAGHAHRHVCPSCAHVAGDDGPQRKYKSPVRIDKKTHFHQTNR